MEPLPASDASRHVSFSGAPSRRVVYTPAPSSRSGASEEGSAFSPGSALSPAGVARTSKLAAAGSSPSVPGPALSPLPTSLPCQLASAPRTALVQVDPASFTTNGDCPPPSLRIRATRGGVSEGAKAPADPALLELVSPSRAGAAYLAEQRARRASNAHLTRDKDAKE